jgi:hypothetical protein
MPGKADILKGRVRDCFRCAVKTRGLEKANAEGDFFFIPGVVSLLVCLMARHILAKTGHFLLKAQFLGETEQAPLAFPLSTVS